jgi:hypothetical protein
VAIRAVLGHEKATESDVERCVESVELFFGNKGVLAASTTIFTLSIGSTLEQVPVCGNQKLLSLLQLGATHTNVGLSENEVCWKQLNRLLIEHLLLNRQTHSVIDNPVSIVVLVHDDELLGLLDRHIDFFTLAPSKKRKSANQQK